MATSPAFQEPHGSRPKQLMLLALGALVALGLLWFVYRLITDVNGVAVKEAPPTAIDMLPPPPPPTPPPPPKPEEKPPEPVDKPMDTPEPAPAPDKPAPAPMQIDGPAQAGADSYGMSAGAGGGMGAPASNGLCIGTNCGGAKGPVAGTDRFWGRNIADALESHIERSRKVNIDSFVGEFDVWVSATGELTQARMVRSTGNSRLDQTIKELLDTARGLKPPPASIRMPQRIKVGRKRY